MSGKVRIIAGTWRGRKITVPNYDAVRPTPDRVRETVFNWLSPYLVDAVCLDAFAGSGALGFEALSRAAKSVYFVEADKHVCKQLHKTATELDAQNLDIICAKFSNAQFKQKFDLIFLDPPFHKNFIAKSCARIVSEHLLNTNGLVYIESEAELLKHEVPESWQLLKQKVAGEVAYSLYQSN